MIWSFIVGGLLTYSGFTIFSADLETTKLTGRGAAGVIAMGADWLGLPYPLIGGVAMLVGVAIATSPFWLHLFLEPETSSQSDYDQSPVS